MGSYKFPESDWKLLRKIREEALAEACEQAFVVVERIAENRTGREHEAYLELWKYFKEKDREIANAFNNINRNNAMRSLINMVTYESISKGKLAEFTEETQQKVLLMTQDRK